ncbi:WG repeat-containing protein, partial [bacterium]|nr:WG repeat-containing protein [bacterium]
MKRLFLFIFLTAFFHSLYAETEKDVVLRMTEDELNVCYADKEKTEQRFLIKQNGYVGFIDGCGRVVIEPVYDSALEFSEGLARVEENGKFGFIDKSGNVVIDFYLDFAWFFHEGLALAEIHGEKEEKFYIDKENKRHPAKNLEKSTDKIITFRKHYDNFILKKRKTKGNALVLGKGLVGGIEYYTDYSGQKFGYVVNDELVETCKNTKLLENDGNVAFVKNGKTPKTLDNFSIYESPVCRDDLTNIVWLKKNIRVSFYENLIRNV